MMMQWISDDNFWIINLLTVKWRKKCTDSMADFVFLRHLSTINKQRQQQQQQQRRWRQCKKQQLSLASTIHIYACFLKWFLLFFFSFIFVQLVIAIFCYWFSLIVYNASVSMFTFGSSDELWAAVENSNTALKVTNKIKQKLNQQNTKFETEQFYLWKHKNDAIARIKLHISNAVCVCARASVFR